MQVQLDERVYVFAWAGRDVETVEAHAPFQLTLRMLIELCGAVIMPVSSGATFDAACKPFCSGVGTHEDCSVAKHTASNTSVQVARLPESPPPLQAQN